jgi:hypothetical protein
MARFIESTGEYWQGSWMAVFDPDVSMCGNARWMLALALAAKQADTVRLALDAIISGVDDGRIDGQSFGEVLGMLLPTGRITLTRWQKSFKEIARVSPAHLQFGKSAIENMLAGDAQTEAALQTDTQLPVAMLELLYGFCTSSGEAIEHQRLRERLTKMGGKGKGAKLAKLLLDLAAPQGGTSHHRKSVAAQILTQRVQRAERWQDWLTREKSECEPVSVAATNE